MAVEMGNCLEAGWFESLVLAPFAERGKPAVQRLLLERIHAARIGFRAARWQGRARISWRRCGATWPVLKPPTSRAWATGGSMSEGSRV